MKHDISKLQELKEFALSLSHNLAAHPDQAVLITLSGDLGAGKTTFTQKLGGVLGIPENEINSPTYVIEQRYPISDHLFFSELVHIDAYRLEQDGDPKKIGLDQTLKDPAKLVIIEWPEKIMDFLKDYKKMAITLAQEGEERLAQITENSL